MAEDESRYAVRKLTDHEWRILTPLVRAHEAIEAQRKLVETQLQMMLQLLDPRLSESPRTAEMDWELKAIIPIREGDNA